MNGTPFEADRSTNDWAVLRLRTLRVLLSVKSFAAFLLASAFLLPATATAAVTVGGLSYSIQDVHTAGSAGPEGLEKQASGEFIVLKLRVANIGHDPATISATDFHLRRGDTKYDADSQSAMMDESFLLTTVNPGTARTGTILFDVPAGSSPSQYELEVFGNGGSVPTYIRL